MPIMRLCVDCGRMIDERTPGTRCTPCQTKQNQRPPRKDHRRGRQDPFYTSPEWRALRKLVLARDGYECQIRRRGCTHAATEVDHITPRSRGGEPLDADNCQSACRTCNRRKGAT